MSSPSKVTRPYAGQPLSNLRLKFYRPTGPPGFWFPVPAILSTSWPGVDELWSFHWNSILPLLYMAGLPTDGPSLALRSACSREHFCNAFLCPNLRPDLGCFYQRAASLMRSERWTPPEHCAPFLVSPCSGMATLDSDRNQSSDVCLRNQSTAWTRGLPGTQIRPYPEWRVELPL